MNRAIRVVFRGDQRDFEEIYKVGGFHPRFTIDPSIKRANPLDVIWHRDNNAAESGFVSTTIDAKIGHRAGCFFS